MSKEIESHILNHFEIKQFIGSGAYGHVWKVVDKQTEKEYALKKIFDAFQNDVDAQRTYREVTILHQLDHVNIIKLESVIKAHNGKDLYLLFEFMETDLHSIIGYFSNKIEKIFWGLFTFALWLTRFARSWSICTLPSWSTVTSNPVIFWSTLTAKVALFKDS